METPQRDIVVVVVVVDTVAQYGVQQILATAFLYSALAELQYSGVAGFLPPMPSQSQPVHPLLCVLRHNV
jgi:F420-0:gamma-glutamyl ligase-like protein